MNELEYQYLGMIVNALDRQADALVIIAESVAPALALDGQANDCNHLAASGVDQTPIGDPDKVWRCDHCGLRWTSGEGVAR